MLEHLSLPLPVVCPALVVRPAESSHAWHGWHPPRPLRHAQGFVAASADDAVERALQNSTALVDALANARGLLGAWIASGPSAPSTLWVCGAGEPAALEAVGHACLAALRHEAAADGLHPVRDVLDDVARMMRRALSPWGPRVEPTAAGVVARLEAQHAGRVWRAEIVLEVGDLEGTVGGVRLRGTIPPGFSLALARRSAFSRFWRQVVWQDARPAFGGARLTGDADGLLWARRRPGALVTLAPVTEHLAIDALNVRVQVPTLRLIGPHAPPVLAALGELWHTLLRRA